MKTLVFPGMHGSSELLHAFCEAAPSPYDVQIGELPPNAFDYQLLTDHFEPIVRELGSCMLIGESFSGPLSVMLAARCANVQRLVLVATFVTPPTPWFAKFLPWRLLLRLPPPRSFVRRFMLGEDCDEALIDTTRQAITSGSTLTMARRMRAVSSVDVRDDLSQLTCDVLYIRPEEDFLVPNRCVDLVRRHKPDVKVVSLPSHHLVLQRRYVESWLLIEKSDHRLS